MAHVSAKAAVGVRSEINKHHIDYPLYWCFSFNKKQLRLDLGISFNLKGVCWTKKNRSLLCRDLVPTSDQIPSQKT
jgi:hypothetical protein